MKLLGATRVREVHGGHQSRVFEVVGPAPRMVVKVHDASMVDRTLLETRAETTAAIAEVDGRVCRPLPVDGLLVTSLDGDDGWTGLVTCFAYATGVAPAVDNRDDAALVGRALAGLHESMKSVEQRALPLVATLATVQPDWSGPMQLLHGDFNTGNLRLAEGVVAIFDFDDCGYGPPAFDVANALYMVLFDDLTGRHPSVFRPFSESFLLGYHSVSDHVLDPADVGGFTDLRVSALELWLDDPATAPVGIRTATGEWQAILRSFVDQYRAQRF